MKNEPEEEGFKWGVETGPDGKTTGNIICYPSFSPNCTVVTKPQEGAVASTGFLSLPEPAPFHDDVLINATREINKILEKVATKGERSAGRLHVILAKEGPMLVWVRAMAMPMEDINKFHLADPH